MSKNFLSRESILQQKDLIVEEVFVKPWNGWVCVKSLTGKERDQWERDIVDVKGKNVITKDNIRAKLVALSVVDPESLKPVFTYGDVEVLGSKNASALDAIFQTASRLSKISDSDVEELVKNSSKTQEGDSTLN